MTGQLGTRRRFTLKIRCQLWNTIMKLRERVLTWSSSSVRTSKGLHFILMILLRKHLQMSY
nr:hypothetical protein Iba_chr09bCG4720 [Ipomoea batatas]GMD35250.1 hypothetical protein Iba_chr09dCG5170 [Ipomoea batatas]GME12898.1 hypothetical protein Iba_scaffold14238CG0190 [Ipomoea batatas]